MEVAEAAIGLECMLWVERERSPSQQADLHLRLMGNGRDIVLSGLSRQMGWKTSSADYLSLYKVDCQQVGRSSHSVTRLEMAAFNVKAAIKLTNKAG